jgi:hypothetical protein
MKQVINGKLYDTESAEQLAKYAPVKDRQDFNFLKEVLYKTEKGSYFIHGQGGPKTKYAKKKGSTTSGSSEIRPLTDEEALSWCEDKQLDGEVVASEFSDLIEKA